MAILGFGCMVWEMCPGIIHGDGITCTVVGVKRDDTQCWSSKIRYVS